MAQVQGGAPTELLLPNELASGVLVQFALQPSLKDVYTEFLRAEGREIFMADPAQYSEGEEEVSFGTLYTRARKHDEVCMGYLRAADARPVLNPDMGTRIKLGPGDRLVMLGEAY